MPVFSCGGMRYQQSWSRGARVSPASQQNVMAIVDRALELGINHIETARGYGTSEAQLGPALSRHPRSSFILQTKSRPQADAAMFEKQLEESFMALGVRHIDLFSFHGLNTPDCLDRTFQRGCYAVVDRFRREGRIQHVGFSTHAPTALIVQAMESGAFDYVNVHYYYIFQDNRPVLETARKLDMGVFIISPTDKGGALGRAPQKLRELTAPLSPIAFNDLWCLSHPDVHTLSIGAARPSDFDEHVGTLALLPDAKATLAPIEVRLEAAYRQALGDAFAAGWQTGLREWHELPQRVNVRRILWLDNLVRAYDLVDYAQERYATMSPDDHWVPGARADALRGDEIGAALPDSPFRHQLPSRLREAHARLSPTAARPKP